jgi:threonylcarbamoyladenosine tRNA methylthiotransferase MtaB
VVGNSQKETLPDLLAEAGFLRDADPVPAADASPLAVVQPDGHTRAFVKVQDGCDNRCTFCIVTVARGVSRSRPMAEVIAEINRLAGLGYQEAVLSGVHLGSYGHDQGNTQGLYHLVQTILNETDIPRLRLSSLEPWDLALRTTQAQFSQLVAAARQAIPDLSITSDIMVGFPGETDAEFEDSISFVEAMAFAKLHIFRYSPRTGTAAAKMKGQVLPQVAQERSRRMHALNAQLERAFRKKFVGRTMPVLWETSEPYGFGLQWSGLTGNYTRVVTQTNPKANLRNRIIETNLVALAPAGLVGQLLVPG